MATFTGVEETTFDLERYVPGMKGTIPEPSSEQIQTFVEVLQTVLPTKEEDGKRILDMDKISEFFEAHEEDAEDIVNDAIAAVCSNTPTAEQIKALPYRVKQGFYGFVTGTYLNPEA